MYSPIVVVPMYHQNYLVQMAYMMQMQTASYYQAAQFGSPSWPSSPVFPSSPVSSQPSVTPPPVNHREHVLRKMCLSRQQMLTNGFPVKIIDKVTIESNKWQMNRKMYYSKGDTSRTCTRCHKKYEVGESGLQEMSTFPVCGENHFHITDQQPEENLLRFKAAPKESMRNRSSSNKLFSIDVEMVYTSLGQEVGRVTMVDEDGTTLVDTLVRPTTQVFDPVTKYSGLTMEHISTATVSLEQCRRMILKCLNEKSILVGHGLNGDLKALRIIHDRVIDTSVLFSANGRKPALKKLTLDHLGYQIQHSESGHCSQEDALASLRLVEYAIENPDSAHF